MSLVEHVETFLGEIERGWKDRSNDQGFQIVSFKKYPSDNTTTFISLGFSENVLNISESKRVRQELVFSTYSMAIPNMIVSLMFSICEAILKRDRAVLRGEVIPLAKDLSKRIGFDAVYCAIPVFVDDEFAAYNETSPATIFVWTIPIHQVEANYVKDHGWGDFESLLEEKDPDLYSLKRKPVI